MGCNCGGGSRAKQNNKTIDSHLMLENWLTSKGFAYQGNCGCRANKKVYDNGTGWQLWVSQDGNNIDIMQICGRDAVKRVLAAPQNIEERFQYAINKFNYQTT